LILLQTFQYIYFNFVNDNDNAPYSPEVQLFGFPLQRLFVSSLFRDRVCQETVQSQHTVQCRTETPYSFWNRISDHPDSTRNPYSSGVGLYSIHRIGFGACGRCHIPYSRLHTIHPDPQTDQRAVDTFRGSSSALTRQCSRRREMGRHRIASRKSHRETMSRTMA